MQISYDETSIGDSQLTNIMVAKWWHSKSILSSTIISWLSTVSRSFSYMSYLFLMDGFMNSYLFSLL